MPKTTEINLNQGWHKQVFQDGLVFQILTRSLDWRKRPTLLPDIWDFCTLATLWKPPRTGPNRFRRPPKWNVARSRSTSNLPDPLQASNFLMFANFWTTSQFLIKISTEFWCPRDAYCQMSRAFQKLWSNLLAPKDSYLGRDWGLFVSVWSTTLSIPILLNILSTRRFVFCKCARFWGARARSSRTRSRRRWRTWTRRRRRRSRRLKKLSKVSRNWWSDFQAKRRIWEIFWPPDFAARQCKMVWDETNKFFLPELIEFYFMTLTVGVWLVSRLDSTPSLHKYNNIFSSLVKYNL